MPLSEHIMLMSKLGEVILQFIFIMEFLLKISIIKDFMGIINNHYILLLNRSPFLVLDHQKKLAFFYGFMD